MLRDIQAIIDLCHHDERYFLEFWYHQRNGIIEQAL